MCKLSSGVGLRKENAGDGEMPSFIQLRLPKNRVLASHSIQGGGASNAFMSGLVYLEASASKSGPQAA